jgi:hypothetical protein
MASEPTAPLLTDDQFQLATKLEGIFMPYASKQRNETYARHNEADVAIKAASLRFVHYTSAEAALNIIRTKRLWMRNAMCMADYREVQHGFDIFNRFFSDQAKLKGFIAALDESAQGAALEAINDFGQRWNTIRFDTFIASVSEHDRNEDLHGRLSMWRGFGGNAARIAMVFNIPWFSGVSAVLNILFSPVAYLKEDQVHRVLDDVVENVRTNREFLKGCGRQVVVDWVFTMLLGGVTCLKHEGFHEEREWRAIYGLRRRPSKIIESSTEAVNGIPQLICKIPLDATASTSLSGIDFPRIFERLIIGPSQYSWPMYEAFTDALAKSGVASPAERVCISGIPIRT